MNTRFCNGRMAALQEVRPEFIIFESHDDGQPVTERPVGRLLSELGSKLYQISRQSFHRIRLVNVAATRPGEGGVDFVAILHLRSTELRL
jgi:hypothetical protein